MFLPLYFLLQDWSVFVSLEWSRWSLLKIALGSGTIARMVDSFGKFFGVGRMFAWSPMLLVWVLLAGLFHRPRVTVLLHENCYQVLSSGWRPSGLEGTTRGAASLSISSLNLEAVINLCIFVIRAWSIGLFLSLTESQIIAGTQFISSNFCIF